MDTLNRKLVFSFYINENYKDKINDIHFASLEYFKDSFDVVNINFVLDDEYPEDFLLDAESRFCKIFCGKEITFKMYKNTQLRESLVFYDRVAKNLKDEGIVFFAHNKGTTNVAKYNRDEIYTWVVAMYYYSLNFKEEIMQQLYSQKYYSYGPFLTKNEEAEKPNKYGWYYIGTFFWVNCKKLYQYMQNENIPLPEIGDRFYAEEFLGNIIQTWPRVMAGSHETRYLTNCYDYYNNARYYLYNLHETGVDGFDDFYKMIVGNE